MASSGPKALMIVLPVYGGALAKDVAIGDAPLAHKLAQMDELQELRGRPLTLHVGIGVTERRLDKYLHGRFRNLSRHFLQDAIRSGGVKVNGKPVKPSFRLTPRRRDRDGDPGAAEQEYRAGEYPAGRPLRGRRRDHPEQAARPDRAPLPGATSPARWSTPWSTTPTSCPAGWASSARASSTGSTATPPA